MKKKTTTKAKTTKKTPKAEAYDPALVNDDSVTVAEMVDGKKAKRSKKAKPEAEKKVTAIDAAYQVLAARREAMSCQEMIAAMAEQGLWTSPGGKTPHATLYSAILRELQRDGQGARFRKEERGKFIAV